MKLSGQLLILMFSVAGFAQQWEWVRQVNGLQNDYCSDLYVDDSGYVYATGRSKLTVTFEDDTNPLAPSYFGHTDAYIVKYTNDGNLVWAQQIGGTDPDWGWNVSVDQNGNVYYTGEYSVQGIFGQDTFPANGVRDVFITKLDNDGNFQWTKVFGSTGLDKGKGIDVDKDGYIYATGFISDTVDVGGVTLGTYGATNGYLVKLDSQGNYIHQVDIQPDFAEGLQIKCDNKGNVYLCGDILYNNFINGFPVTGPTTLAWADGFLAKMDTAFNVSWVNLVKSSFANMGESLAISDNYVYLTGFFTHNADFSGIALTYNGTGATATDINSARDAYIAKYDTSGNIIWVTPFGSTGNDHSWDIDVTPEDNIYITGNFENTVQFGSSQLTSQGATDVFMARLDSEGNFIWVKQHGGIDDVFGYAVCADQHQNIFFGGAYTQNSNDFDGIIKTNSEKDAYIGKVTQHPDPQITSNDTAFCEGDTVMLYPSTITTPIIYTWDITSQIGWVQNDTFCFVALSGNPDITGHLIAANNIYADTLLIDQTITIYPGVNCGLGIEKSEQSSIEWTYFSGDQILQIESLEYASIEIYNVAGRLVGRYTSVGGRTQLNFNVLAPGIYLIKLSTKDGECENFKLFLK